jgi:hypothetical protein
MNTVTREFSMTINGKAVLTENTVSVINPANESVIAQVPEASQNVLRQLNQLDLLLKDGQYFQSKNGQLSWKCSLLL